MADKFNNNASQVLFIGARNLDEVIAQDSAELIQVRGSFEDIANRMQAFVDFAKGKGYILGHEEQSALVSPVLRRFVAQYGDNFSKNDSVWRSYGQEWGKKMAEHPKTWYDNTTAVIQFVQTRGFQLCPFEGCKGNAWGEDVQIVSRKNGRQLTVNSGTAHLARVHHLLEKDNEYGISSKEFYDAFMPQ